MARPKSEERRTAILDAATSLIAAQGLGAATADIAKRAGVPHGSVFTYFETKAELCNVLYQVLTTELTDVVVSALTPVRDTRPRLQAAWDAWTAWGVASPDKRRTQAHLNVSDLVTAEVRDAAYAYAAPFFDLIREAAKEGPLRDAPIRYTGSIVAAAAATTIEFMLQDQAEADRLRRMGFDAIWHALH